MLFKHLTLSIFSQHSHATRQYLKVMSIITFFAFCMLSITQFAIAENLNPFSDKNTQEAVSQTEETNNNQFPASNQTEFLTVHNAFQSHFSIDKDKQQIYINWDIAEGYYLYKKRFKFSTDQSDTVTLLEPIYSPEPTIKDDAYFGKTEVFKHTLSVTLPFKANKDGTFNLTTTFQGCAEKGLCYPPTKIIQVFEVKTDETQQAATSENTSIKAEIKSNVKPKPTQAPIAQANSAQGIAAQLEESNLFARLLLTLILGIGLTFTPCVLPMIPILSSIIAGQNQASQSRTKSTKKGFALSMSYVLGMSLAFALSGVIVAYTGAKIQLFFQNPVVLSGFALIFVLLSLSMFGFYEIQLPRALQDRLSTLNQKQQGGTYLGVFMMGILSALVVSPCVSAPLAGILLLIAKEGNLLQGGLSLFSLGFGMGLPLLVIGTTGANIMPKAGGWMDAVKGTFGVLLLAIGAWLIRSVLPDEVMMFIWAALLIMPSIYMGLFETPHTPWQKFWKGFSILLFTYGLMILIGLGMGQTNPLQPIKITPVTSGTLQTQNMPSSGLSFNKVRTLAELHAEINKAKTLKKPIMVDFYADWCIACIEMEHQVFSQNEVIQKLQPYYLIQVDITDNNEADALLDEFKLIGPPAILFWNAQGEALTEATILGSMDKSAFLSHLSHL